ncbi:MAG TPA: tungstate ABC transporter substrate-binding protein WtpA [Methanobacterium sp.]|jgi:molybdate/tungstate transport system substrate-binding protein|nr:tungstate ABC transporter substrate-binding protein WtpA [Methanobacterium sp.]
MNNKAIAAMVIIVIAVVAIGVYGYTSFVSPTSQNGTLTIMAASSLSNSMNATAAEFEKRHPNVKVQIQYGGSGDLISQITQLNKKPDIMASADYGLIDKSLMPDFTTWNLKYAKNEMVIAYTDQSTNASQINADNWYQILAQDDVKFGIADPNSAPAGYRAVMMMQLANKHYNNDTIFETLIESNTAITSEANGTGFVINSPNNLAPTDKVTSRPNVRDTLTLLESGSVDYVFVYKSDAQQAGGNIKYLELPDELKLSDTQFEPDYKTIQLIQFSDLEGSNKTKTITLTPIVYGITILTDAAENDLAIEFMELLLSNEGNTISQDNFIDPLVPAVPTTDSAGIPNQLNQYITS